MIKGLPLVVRASAGRIMLLGSVLGVFFKEVDQPSLLFVQGSSRRRGSRRCKIEVWRGHRALLDIDAELAEKQRT